MRVSVIMPVLFEEAWQVPLARAAIGAMRLTTKEKFELVVVETLSSHLRGDEEIDIYLLIEERSRYTRDFNAGLDAATGDIVVHTGLDVFTAQGWLEELLRVLDEYPLAGAATLACREGGSVPIGPREPLAPYNQFTDPGAGLDVVEGMYGPFFAFRRRLLSLSSRGIMDNPNDMSEAEISNTVDTVDLRMDETYNAMACDSDLVMQIYEAGWRCYRSGRVVVSHLNGASMRSRSAEARQRNLELGQRTFFNKWGASPLWMARMCLRGGVAYGREHEC